MKKFNQHITFITIYIVGSFILGLPSVYASVAEEHFEKAMKYQFTDNPEAAIAEYKQGLHLNPNSVDGHAKLGTLLLDERGDVDGAISEFISALTIDPDCHFCQTRLNEAVSRKNATIEESLNFGNDFYRSGNLLRAAAVFRIAVENNPGNAEAHNHFAWTLYRLGKLDEGLSNVNEALRLKPDEPEYVNTLACIQFDLGKVSEAIANWKKAIAKSTTPNPADLYGLAIGYLTNGDQELALKSFKEALKIDPEYADMTYLQDKIGLSVHALATHDKLLALSKNKKD